MTLKVAARPDSPESAVGSSLERLLNEKEVAGLLGISTRSLQNYRVDGGGPEFIRIGRRVAYEPAAVRCWIAAQRRRSTADQGAA